MREAQSEPRFLANREARLIPQGWEHPRDAHGRYVPLLPGQMPAVDGVAEVVAYETATEGTPLSPGFSDTPDGRLQLIRYCVEHNSTFGQHRAGAEAWAAILFGEGASIAPDGAVQA